MFVFLVVLELFLVITCDDDEHSLYEAGVPKNLYILIWIVTSVIFEPWISKLLVVLRVIVCWKSKNLDFILAHVPKTEPRGLHAVYCIF